MLLCHWRWQVLKVSRRPAWFVIAGLLLQAAHECPSVPTCLLHGSGGLVTAESPAPISHIFLFPPHLLTAIASVVLEEKEACRRLQAKGLFGFLCMPRLLLSTCVHAHAVGTSPIKEKKKQTSFDFFWLWEKEEGPKRPSGCNLVTLRRFGQTQPNRKAWFLSSRKPWVRDKSPETMARLPSSREPKDARVEAVKHPGLMTARGSCSPAAPPWDSATQ